MIGYISMSVPKEGPIEQQHIEQFTRIIEDESLRPLLVHWGSANRVGSLWAIYQHSREMPAELAFEAGKTIGMETTLEEEVRQRLGF